ncbi:MAG: hypothetical protein V4732_02320 [Pseudomonadota bacterium]
MLNKYQASHKVVEENYENYIYCAGGYLNFGARHCTAPIAPWKKLRNLLDVELKNAGNKKKNNEKSSVGDENFLGQSFDRLSFKFKGRPDIQFLTMAIPAKQMLKKETAATRHCFLL